MQEFKERKKEAKGPLEAKSIKVFAPASVANVVCGYDVLGFAVETPGDYVSLTLNDSKTVTLDLIEGDNGKLPLSPDKNTASAVIIKYLEHIGIKQGVSVKLYKEMPLNSGMGSSSASSVAALVAINELMGNPLTRLQLLPFAMEGERLACGNAHADNVAPALLGGLVLIRSYDPLDVVKLPVPKGLYCALVYPHVDVPTRGARKILKERVDIRDAVTQWGNVAGLVAGFCTNDTDLIGRSMEDVIIEPIRSILIPGFYKMKELALRLGAIGFGISGSGPSVFALCSNKELAGKVAKALSAMLHEDKVANEYFVSSVNMQGPRIISQNSESI